MATQRNFIDFDEVMSELSSAPIMFKDPLRFMKDNPAIVPFQSLCLLLSYYSPLPSINSMASRSRLTGMSIRPSYKEREEVLTDTHFRAEAECSYIFWRFEAEIT